MFPNSKKYIALALMSLGLSACGGSSDDSNQLPTITAEVPNQVDELSLVNLVALAQDIDGQVSQYSWTQTSGIEIQLVNSATNSASFIAPEVLESETVQVSLQVTDNEGAVVNQPFSITINNVNKAPIVTTNASSHLDELSQASITANATDLDGDIQSYTWQQTQGPILESVEYNEGQINFTLPEVNEDQIVRLELMVTDNEGAITIETIDIMVMALSLAETHAITSDNVSIVDTHPSIFISGVMLDLQPNLISSLSFMVTPLENAKATAINATYSISELTQSEGGVVLPIFGLYRGYENDVVVTANYIDGSSSSHSVLIATEALIQPEGNAFNSYTINSTLKNKEKASYDYFLMKSGLLGPVIMDVDGNVRWQAMINDYVQYTGQSSLFYDNQLVLALNDEIHYIQLDGTTKTYPIVIDGLSDISAHHELSVGKQGLLVELDANKTNLEERIIESILIEVDDKGNVIKYWDFADIFVDYLLKNGEDPTNFVRNGVDWFHMNTAIYDPSDNSLVVSSRENFVVKIDYDTSEIKWLLGDETKHWYVNYPSLRSLSLQSNDQKPIGQHSLSIVNGQVMLFNNGQLSFNQPEDAPKGEKLNTSIAARYVIDEEQGDARIDWQYDPNIYSDVCSSIYQDRISDEGDYLINYSAVNRLNDDPLTNIVRGINEDKELLFEIIFDLKSPCGVSWNSEIIYGLDRLVFE